MTRLVLHRLWYDGVGSLMTRGVATIAEGLMTVAVWVRNAWYDRVSLPQNPVPVISVGNLSVGGTGKTPFLRWIGEDSTVATRQLGVVTGGYGDDEVELYRRWFGPSRVVVEPDRRKGVRQAAESGVSIVLVDDGFQHRRLRRDCDIVLVAAEGPWPVRLLPRGPYREPLGSLGRASLIVVTARTSAEEDIERLAADLRSRFPRVPVGQFRLTLGDWSALNGDPVSPPSGDLLALASVGRPNEFLQMLRETCPSQEIELMPFPDHHSYNAGDIQAALQRADGRTIVTTEKDAVKLRRFPEASSSTRVVNLVGRVPEDDPIHRVLEHASAERGQR